MSKRNVILSNTCTDGKCRISEICRRPPELMREFGPAADRNQFSHNIIYCLNRPVKKWHGRKCYIWLTFPFFYILIINICEASYITQLYRLLLKSKIHIMNDIVKLVPLKSRVNYQPGGRRTIFKGYGWDKEETV